MRMFALLVGLTTCVQAQDVTEPKAHPDDKVEADRAVEAAASAQRAARAYRIGPVADEPSVYKLEPRSLLRWSNPVTGSFHGSVFVWTAKGRPEVIASIYKKYVPLPPHLGIEFHSLATEPVRASRDGRPEWFPTGAGVQLKPVEGAPTPAGTPAQRLRQLRALAREFTAAKTDRKGDTRELRLLTQPIFRYETTDPALPDGGLFAFVEGTDPEVFLQIETRRADGRVAWHYTVCRMNSVALRVNHRGREVWSVPMITWEEAMNPRDPYTLLMFSPGQGPNTPADAAAP
jgi:hypothetical protein